MSKRILLVDDDVDYLAGMQVQLESLGFEITTAENIAEGMEAISSNPPDLAIVDLMIEEQDDGFCLCYAIKKRDPSIPVIMITAVLSETGFDFDAATDEERRWIKADAFLTKPVRIEQLQREIKRLMKE